MWTVYSKNDCPYCEKAKFILDSRQLSYEVKNISTDPALLQELMTKNPAARTMPQIFKEDQLVGGYDQLVSFLKGE
jgi:glutaredoxin